MTWLVRCSIFNVILAVILLVVGADWHFNMALAIWMPLVALAVERGDRQ